MLEPSPTFYELTININPESGGSITANPLNAFGHFYLVDTVVTLTAKPNAGYAFTGWSGDASGSVNPTTVTMDGDKFVTANYALPGQAGTLAFKSASYSIGEVEGSVRLYVTRSGGVSGPASVAYTIVTGTATAGADYSAATTGTLTWYDGSSADKYFDVTILDDSIYEGNETFTVNLSQASGATLGSPSTTLVTIMDDETPPLPSPATAPSPANGATGVSVNSTLSWANGAERPVTMCVSEPTRR